MRRRTAACKKCLKPFSYTSTRTHWVCPACVKSNMRRHNEANSAAKHLLPTEEPADHLSKNDLLGMSREDVAWRLGLTKDEVDIAERNALAKIRRHPDAKRLFKLWKADGTPTPAPGREVGELLLNMQMELSRMREVYEVISDPEEGTPEEAAEYKKEIDAFARALWGTVRKLTPE